MIDISLKSRFLLALAFLIGVVGVYGQAYLLYHELVDCLPYKILNADFHRSVALAGMFTAPIISLAAGILLGIKRFWLAALAPVVICPLLFAVIYISFSLFSDNFFTKAFFDEQSAVMVGKDFILKTFSLAVAGLLVGGICSLLLRRFSKEKKLL